MICPAPVVPAPSHEPDKLSEPEDAFAVCGERVGYDHISWLGQEWSCDTTVLGGLCSGFGFGF